MFKLSSNGIGEGALLDGTFTGSRGVGSITDTSWESSSSSESSSNAENNDFFLTMIVSSGFDSDFNFLILIFKKCRLEITQF